MKTPSELGDILNRAAALIAARPSVGQEVYKSTAVLESGLACRMYEKAHVLEADLPREVGGCDEGPSPGVLLRAALSSCVAMGVKMWAARRGVSLDGVEVTAEFDFDARGQFGISDAVAPGFEDIRVAISVRSAAPLYVLQEIVETSLRYSPLMDVLRRPHAVATKVCFDQEGT